MKLNIDFIQDQHKFGRPRAIITDDRGEKLPGVRAVDINYKLGDAAIAVVTLVVDGKRVSLGSEAPQPAPGYFDCIKGGLV